MKKLWLFPMIFLILILLAGHFRWAEGPLQSAGSIKSYIRKIIGPANGGLFYLVDWRNYPKSVRPNPILYIVEHVDPLYHPGSNLR